MGYVTCVYCDLHMSKKFMKNHICIEGQLEERRAESQRVRELMEKVEELRKFINKGNEMCNCKNERQPDILGLPEREVEEVISEDDLFKVTDKGVMLKLYVPKNKVLTFTDFYYNPYREAERLKKETEILSQFKSQSRGVPVEIQIETYPFLVTQSRAIITLKFNEDTEPGSLLTIDEVTYN